jgi:hypothetical protein
MSDLDRIVVDVPQADSSRHRVEPRMFERLDAIRAAGRAGELAPDRRPSRWLWLAVPVAAAAVIAIVLATRHAPDVKVASPSLVVTPAGGSSRFTIDDAVIDAGGDTSVEVQAGERGAVTLVLARGTIDCEVAPRNGRPFVVIAGDVSVEVVGTRFAVTRGATVRVDVTHGRVRVHAPTGDVMVGAGERWPAGELAATQPPPPVEPPPPPASAPEIAMDPTPAHAPTPHDHYIAATKLEAKNWTAAAQAYRTAATGSDRWAALALYSLAELEATHEMGKDALAALDEYRRRFARGANAEDAAWLRVETLRKLGRADDARAAAAEYVQRFPTGTYLTPASRLAAPR